MKYVYYFIGRTESKGRYVEGEAKRWVCGLRQGRIHISLTRADKRVIKKYIALSQPVARDLIEDRKGHEQH